MLHFFCLLLPIWWTTTPEANTSSGAVISEVYAFRLPANQKTAFRRISQSLHEALPGEKGFVRGLALQDVTNNDVHVLWLTWENATEAKRFADKLAKDERFSPLRQIFKNALFQGSFIEKDRIKNAGDNHPLYEIAAFKIGDKRAAFKQAHSRFFRGELTACKPAKGASLWAETGDSGVYVNLVGWTNQAEANAAARELQKKENCRAFFATVSEDRFFGYLKPVWVVSPNAKTL